VQKPPGDAAVALHPAGNPANPWTAATHFYIWPTKLEFRKLRKSGKPRIALMNYRAKITARRNRSE
jgi:hypothetical protein